MNMKWIGAALVIACCGWFGFSFAASHRREEQALKQLIGVLDYISCELQYRLTPLPELCRKAAANTGGIIALLFDTLAQEMEDQFSPNVSSCMNAAIRKIRNIPSKAEDKLVMLGRSLGRFDIQGQLLELEAVRQECVSALDSLTQNREARLRSYQTLGLCAGAALVILFI